MLMHQHKAENKKYESNFLWLNYLHCSLRGEIFCEKMSHVSHFFASQLNAFGYETAAAAIQFDLIKIN